MCLIPSYNNFNKVVGCDENRWVEFGTEKDLKEMETLRFVAKFMSGNEDLYKLCAGLCTFTDLRLFKISLENQEYEIFCCYKFPNSPILSSRQQILVGTQILEIYCGEIKLRKLTFIS